MKKIVRDFFRSSPETIHDIEGLHRFRIEGKRLRYAIEILAAAFPAALRVEVYPRIEALQEKLGEIHDRHVAIRRFQNWAAETDNRSEKNQLLRLADADATRLSSLVEEFRAWWSPKYQADLQRKFRKIVRRAEQRC